VKTLMPTLALLSLAALSLVPQPYRVASGVFDNHGDHALAYAVATVAIIIAAGLRDYFWSSGIGLCGVAGILELCQSLSPGRVPAFGDFLASTTGIGLGLAVAALLMLAHRQLTQRSFALLDA
jgi:hypothetical protein